MNQRGFMKLLHAYIYLSARYYRLEYLRLRDYPDEPLNTMAECVDRARYKLWLIHDRCGTAQQLEVWAGTNSVVNSKGIV